MASIDDPLLQELLTALKQDSREMASDLLSVITAQTLVAAFALFLAISSLARLLLFEVPFGTGGPMFGPSRTLVSGREITLVTDANLTVVLFALSLVSIYNLLRLRKKYSKLLAIAEKLGR